MSPDVLAAAVAAEALKKTAGGVIDALLGPKLKRLGQWAAARDVQGRVKSDQVEAALSAYGHRLLRRVCGFTTLVFPEHVLSLPDAYEPVKLRWRGFWSVKVHVSHPLPSMDAASELAISRRGARAFIVDGAGMGKSTFVRYLAMSEIIQRDKIPLFLELRSVTDGRSLIEALASDLDELGRPFDRDVFRALLTNGDFLVILDGLDEVAESRRGIISAEIEDLAVKADASIVVTARPEVPLPRLLDSLVAYIAPLTQTQAASLVRRYDRIAGGDVGERLIPRFPSVPDKFRQTPLLLALLYRSFAYNGEVSTRISSFYEELYLALYKGHDLTKTGYARLKASGLILEDFRRLLRATAFLMVAREKEAFSSQSAAYDVINEATKLAGVRPSSAEAFLDDLLLAVPLMVRDGNVIRFAHRTVGEYFAAEYVAFAEKAADLLAWLCRKTERSSYARTALFVTDLSPTLFRRVVIAPIARQALMHRAHLGQTSSLRTATFLWPNLVLTLQKQDPAVMAIGVTGFIGGDSYALHVLGGLDFDVVRVSVTFEHLCDSVAIKASGTPPQLDFAALEPLVDEASIALSDEQLESDAFRPTIERALMTLIAQFAYMSPRADGPLNSVGYVLNDERTQSVLDAVTESHDSDDLLRDLLADG